MASADVVLAAIPLAAKVLDTCLRGYDLFTEAKEIGHGSHTLLWKFRIQQTRLHMWAREWGILDESQRQGRTPRDPEDYRIITETLFRISDLVTDYKAIRSRYGLSLVTEDPRYTSQRIDGPIEEVIAQEFSEYHEQDQDLRRDRTKASNFMKKFRWVATDKGKFESIIKDLKEYNDGLYHLLAAAERRSLRHGLSAELVTTNNISDLLDLEAASSGYEELPQVSALRRHQIETSSSERPGRLRVSGKDIALCQTDHGEDDLLKRAPAYYTSEKGRYLVLVEWKSFDRDAKHSARLSQLDRIDSLARLLHISAKPKELRVPSCIGYFADDWHPRIGLIFEYSVKRQDNFIPRTLHELLIGGTVPYLGDRFRLAYELCLSLSLLHSSGWLHKSIRSDNILFACDTAEDNGRQSLQEPLLLGFEHSRPDTPFANTDVVISAQEYQNLYRHPRSIGSTRDRFSRAFDIYSLGIVLIEIGFWRPISEFWTDNQTLTEFHDDLCHFYVPNLGSKVGEIYMEAVQCCLSGKLADMEIDDARSQKGFYWEVVRELARLMA